MYLILLLAGLGGVGGGLLTVLQGVGKRIPAALWVVAPAGVATLGGLGTISGITMTRKALAAVSPETAPMLAAAGLGASIHTTTLGLLGAAGLLAMSALGLAVSIAGSTPDAQWSIPHALPAAGVLGVGAISLGVGTALDLGPAGALPGLFALLGSGAAFAAAVRWPPDPDDKRRVAHGRIAVAGLLGASVLFAGLLAGAIQESQGYQAMLAATELDHEVRLVAIEALSRRGRWLGLMAGIPAGLIAATTAWPVRHHVGDTAGWVSGGIGAAGIVVALFSLFSAGAAQDAVWRAVTRTLGG